MATVKVKFRPSTVADRPGSIIIIVTNHRVVRQITTGYKVFPCEWDEKQSRLVSTVENGRIAAIQSITQRLCWDVERLHGIIGRLDSRQRGYSTDDVVSEFQRTGKENTFFIFMENVIVRLRQLGHTGTANNYRAALGSFKRFRVHEDIPIGAIDHVIMEDYQAYLNAAGLAPNSTSFYMRILRAVYNRAVEQEPAIDRKPFRTVFTGTEKTRKRAISIGDIRRIKDLDLSRRPNLEFARDVFLFLFLCRGMSFIDAAFLRKSDIQNGVLTYRRHKTGQQLQVKIIRQIEELTGRYPTDGLPYLLPIITVPGKDERKQYESALRRVNKSLKTIAEMAKLPVTLTTYVTRHTWATIAKSKNVPVNVISDALGHDSVTTTQIYLASIDSSIIDNANELVVSEL